jgi:hypothetical protein
VEISACSWAIKLGLNDEKKHSNTILSPIPYTRVSKEAVMLTTCSTKAFA